MDAPFVVFIIFTFLGTAFLAAGTGTDHWQKLSLGKIETSQGLFRVCNSYKDNHSCRKLYDDFGDLKVRFAGVVICMILSIVLVAIAWIAALIGKIANKTTNRVVILHLIASVLFAIGGLSLFTHNYGKGSWELSWSYGLCWGGTALNLIGTIAFILVSLR